MAAEETRQEMIHTQIWHEEPQADNPFIAEHCFCSGFNVYQDLLRHASWFEYLYLLFTLEKPDRWQADMLEKIAVAIAHPGIRDHSVRAAMCAGVGGSTAAASLMAALAVGAGQLNGAREIYLVMERWHQCGTDLTAWRNMLKHPPRARRATVWPYIDHPPGFDPHGSRCAQPVLATLAALTAIKPSGRLAWLTENRPALESYAGSPLAMPSVIATAFVELDLSSEQAEMMYLMLRLPGAAAHALEQKQIGWKKYPFFGADLKIVNDPGK